MAGNIVFELYRLDDPTDVVYTACVLPCWTALSPPGEPVTCICTRRTVSPL